MREHINGDSIANTIRMTRSLHPGAFMIVEGETDCRVYERFTDPDNCRVIFAVGKGNARKALKRLEQDGFEGAIAVVDSDFWKLDGVYPDSANLFSTDTHDLETMMLSSAALDDLLNEFGAPPRIAREGGDVRPMILESGRPLGYLRWLSSSTDYDVSLRLKGLPIESVIDERTLRVNLDDLVMALERRSGRKVPNKKELLRKVTRLLLTGQHDPWQVCCGHDLVNILTIGLKNVFGNRKARALSVSIVDSVLRLSYRFVHFAETQLFRSILEWEKNNPGYVILLRHPEIFPDEEPSSQPRKERYPRKHRFPRNYR